MKKHGFTLAEIMIVLVLIGVISAIVIPVAKKSMPDKNIMKFRKANTQLYNAINKLVTSNKYYCNGDLGLKAPDCTLLKVTDSDKNYDLGTPISENIKYFCQTMANVITTKSVNCSDLNTDSGAVLLSGGNASGTISALCIKHTTNDFLEKALISSDCTTKKFKLRVTDLEERKQYIDDRCKINASKVGAEITTPEGIVFYSSRPYVTFGTLYYYERTFSPSEEFPAHFGDQNGYDIHYKIVCIDIDGIPDGASWKDCINECPFGYGIRADGKIFRGKRAEEWLEKSTAPEN